MVTRYWMGKWFAIKLLTGMYLCFSQYLLTLTQTIKRATYLVFDVLFINGVYYGGNDLTNRLQKIRDFIIVPYRKAVDRGTIEKNHSFTIIGKQFFDKKYTKKVFDHIRKEKRAGEEAYYYHDEKRHHKTDGLIFTPDEPYVPFTNPKLFKWKYMEKNTIDFKLMPFRDNSRNYIPGASGDETYLLTCRGKGSQGSDIECDVAQFLPEDVVKLKVCFLELTKSKMLTLPFFFL